MLCAECEKNLIEKPFKFCIHWSITLCAECGQCTGYSCIFSSAHITCGSIMASDVRREAMKTGLGEEESAIEIEKRETSEEKRTRLLNSFILRELEYATC